MTTRTAFAACVALFAASLASRSAVAETPTIYKWIDENGVAHYTTDRSRIPSEIGTRVERAPSVSPPAPATATHPDDELRDAVRVKPAAAPPAPPAPSSTAAVPAPDATPPPVASAPPPVATPPAPAPAATSTAPTAAEPKAAAPKAAAPLAADKPSDPDPVSAPPPAPVAPLAPKQTAELAKIDGQIQTLEAEISDHEEKLATLISTADDQKPLVDDPKFREISQRLPKLQAELQSLREERNKIQPATP